MRASERILQLFVVTTWGFPVGNGPEIGDDSRDMKGENGGPSIADLKEFIPLSRRSPCSKGGSGCGRQYSPCGQRNMTMKSCSEPTLNSAGGSVDVDDQPVTILPYNPPTGTEFDEQIQRCSGLMLQVMRNFQAQHTPSVESGEQTASTDFVTGASVPEPTGVTNDDAETSDGDNTGLEATPTNTMSEGSAEPSEVPASTTDILGRAQYTTIMIPRTSADIATSRTATHSVPLPSPTDTPSNDVRAWCQDLIMRGTFPVGTEGPGNATGIDFGDAGDDSDEVGVSKSSVIEDDEEDEEDEMSFAADPSEVPADEPSDVAPSETPTEIIDDTVQDSEESIPPLRATPTPPPNIYPSDADDQTNADDAWRQFFRHNWREVIMNARKDMHVDHLLSDYELAWEEPVEEDASEEQWWKDDEWDFVGTPSEGRCPQLVSSGLPRLRDDDERWFDVAEC